MRAPNSKILIGPSLFCAVDKAPLDKLKSTGLEIIQNTQGRKLTKDELCALLPGVVGLIAGLEPLGRDVLEQSQLKVISRCGAGLSNVDLQAAARLGIRVRSTPDAPTSAVAELTVGVMLNLMRQVPQMDRELHNGVWEKRVGAQLEGKTVLLIGFGRIGRKVASLLYSFGVRLVAVDPALNGIVEGIPIVSLHTALPQADVISLHAVGDTEILGEREFSLVKPGAFLLNAGRGRLVNERFLCRALETGAVAGAWLDTFSQEPYEGPLTSFQQVILTPHIGSASVECRRRMEMESVENLLAALAESFGGA